MNQRIFNIEQFYPFGEVREQDGVKTFIRRLVSFTDERHRSKLRHRIDILKGLKLPLLVQLVSVLQEDGVFHLMYECVPFRLKYDRKQLELLIRQQLEELLQTMLEKGLKVQLEPMNIGMNNCNEVKYYLDIDQVTESRITALQAENGHQLNRFMDYLNREPSSSKTEPVGMGFDYTLPTETASTTPTSTYRKPNNYKSCSNLSNVGAAGSLPHMSSSSSGGTSPIQMLQRIEDRLNTLNKMTKKYTPAMRQTFKSKEHLRETVKEKWKTEKIDTRKMSGHTIYTSMFMKGGSASKAVEREMSAREVGSRGSVEAEKSQIQNRNRIEIPKAEGPRNGEPIHNVVVIPPPIEQKKLKQPLSKKDFIELQKTQFQNYFQSKETYVHEFLDVLGELNEAAPAKSEACNTSRRQVSNNIDQFSKEKISSVQAQYQLVPQTPPSPKTVYSMKYDFSTRTDSPSQYIGRNKGSSKSPEKGQELHSFLKNRIQTTIKNCDIAIQRIRKNSVHTQIGVRK